MSIHNEYTASGSDKEEYNKEGFNRQGWNREGYDREGYDKHGYDKEGYNRAGFNRKGLNREGYNKEGYNQAGYSKAGYDKYGYDKEGYTKAGFNRQGLNREGYNKEGYNQAGYSKAGFDKEGYDKEGYNRAGLNRQGLDREGYNKEGYDKYGYDKEGYNKAGFNRQGLDREGYNKEGYNQAGYSKAGYNKDGYDINGYDRYGFDKTGYDANGRDIYGYNKNGFNLLGYDHNGFNQDGIHRKGYTKAEFDEDGYHLITGFNIYGFDREGYNADGFNAEGYDRNGYDAKGFDRDGFDRNGFDIEGYDIEGFNKEGFDREAYDKKGYNIDGFDRKGYDREGYDKSGYDIDGYDRDGYDKNGQEKTYTVSDIFNIRPGMTVYHTMLGRCKVVEIDEKGHITVEYLDIKKANGRYGFPGAFGQWLSLNKPEKFKQRENSYVATEDIKERSYYHCVEDYLRGPYMQAEIAEARRGYKPNVIQFIDDNGFLASRDAFPEMIDYAVNDAEIGVEQLACNPYFAHISYFGEKNLYIGKKEICDKIHDHNYVIDWADARASLYYQYQIYIGSPNYNLELVREIDISNGTYIGYRDLYNALTSMEKGAAESSDERLSRIILANRENKKIHDIVETIQRNQYEIITQSPENNILVLGCAGSGKTMILMHKIRYMKYNNANLDMQKILVISPTDILGRESAELSRILNINAVQQLTMTQLYSRLIREMISNVNGQEYLLKNTPIVISEPDIELYKEENLARCLNGIYKLLDLKSKESVEYIKTANESLKEAIEPYRLKYGKKLDEKYNLYLEAQKELHSYNKSEIMPLISCMEQKYPELGKIRDELKIVALAIKLIKFKEINKEIEESEEKKKEAEAEEEAIQTGEKKDEYEDIFRETRKLATFIELDEAVQYVQKHDIAQGTPSSFLQILCAFQKGQCTIEKKLLYGVRRELGRYTQSYVEGYKTKLEKRKQNLEKLQKKANILRFLVSNKLFDRAEGIYKGEKKININSVGNAIYKFFENMNWEPCEKNPFDEFDIYDQIKDKEQRLKQFESSNINVEDKHAKWSFLQDILYDKLQISNGECQYRLDASKVFALVYILQKLSAYVLKDKYYVFVDEFQDFSNIELRLLNCVFQNGTFNLFGDFHQCINPKGIMRDEEFEMREQFKIKYHINENYRNAKQITEYVNKEFGIGMLGIGLPGHVSRGKLIPLKLAKGDRGAIIVADSKRKDEIEIKGTTVYNFEKEGEIYRNAFNLIPVSMAKGLEFEKVIVLTDGMTENQRYVAYTRAINQLYIVEREPCELGDMYYKGEGVEQDYAEAVKWYQKAADQGNAAAYYKLGYMYEHGEGVEQDYAEAMIWYQKAAEHDNASAQYELGWLYENGIGVQQDDLWAMEYYHDSMINGNTDARLALYRVRDRYIANYNSLKK